MTPDVKPELLLMINEIAQRNMYRGNRIPEAIMAQFGIEEDTFHCGVTAPFWIAALQYGRGPRRSTRNSGLVDRIYDWMKRHNMFRRVHGRFPTEAQRRSQARFITWYINKFGNQQFRNKVFVDIYKTARERAIVKINEKFSEEISRITYQAI